MKPGVLLLFLLLTAPSFVSAQSVVLYKVKVVTEDGKRFRGILDDVSDTHINVSDNLQAFFWFRHSGGQVALSDVRKVIIRKQSRRKPTLHGVIVGGLLTGTTTVLSSQKNGFRSPVLYGLNVMMATGGGAIIGALVGNNIGSLSRKTVRPRRRRQGEYVDGSSENLRRQLEPFTYIYQRDVLNRIQP